MPACGTQVLNCNVPTRCDSYRGCTFACEYCLEWQKRSGAVVPKVEDTVERIERFIFFRSETGGRNVYTRWCDWDIPLHWGGIADPFQPCELEMRNSLAIMELFAETGYPYILQTKGVEILQRPEYMSLMERSNMMLQVSLCAPEYDSMEVRVPSYAERLRSLIEFAQVCKRVVVRCLPYTLEIHDSVIGNLHRYAGSGVYGLSIEGMKWYCRTEKYPELTHYFGGSFSYPEEVIAPHYGDIRNACFDNGLEFWCCDNRLREIGYPGTCCGCDGLVGFRVNTANLNTRYPEYTNWMKDKGSAGVFRSYDWTGTELESMSYAEALEKIMEDKLCVEEEVGGAVIPR